MYLYAIAIAALITTIIFLILTYKNYKQSNKATLSDEDRAKATKKYKNDLVFFAVFAVICEIFILLAKKYTV